MKTATNEIANDIFHMELTYKSVIDALNEYKIQEMHFSVRGYGHYRDCKVIVQRDKLLNAEFYVIKFILTKDGTENIGFYKQFNENEKIFRLKNQGKFTLKQIWDRICITEIKYFE